MVAMKSVPGKAPAVVGSQERHRPLWTLTEKEFADLQVTPLSRGGDQIWRLDPTTPGMKASHCRVNWSLILLDGSSLTDPQHSERLAWAKKLLAIILLAPSQGIVPAPASMASFQQSFRWLISWMAMRAVQTPDKIDPAVYIDELPQLLEAHTRDDEISKSAAWLALMLLTWLWTERRQLELWGVKSLQANPFDGRGANYYSKSIATKAAGWIPPLPDEVAIPLFNKVYWWLGTPADDVVRLIACMYPSRVKLEADGFERENQRRTGAGSPGADKGERPRMGPNLSSEYFFCTPPGDSTPWRPSLQAVYEMDRQSPPHRQVTTLFKAVREACIFCIQGMSGMRISEILGIEAGFESQSGLPKGVRIEESATGLYSVYIINTPLSKTESGLPRGMDWVLGMIPKGSPGEPLPVRALRILNHLHEPWRTAATTSRLLLADTTRHVLSSAERALGAATSDPVRDAMKRFIAQWVDLSNLQDESRHKIVDNDLRNWRESKGMIFKSHMLRKSWAQFMFAVDPRLMPAIQMQFHHLSMAMTDTGYIGSNPLLVGDMESVGTQARNRLMLEMVLGRSPLAGRMGERLEQATVDLKARVKDLPTRDAYTEVVRFCERARLPIFFSPHGACMPVQTHEMRCHDEAGTSVFLRKQPLARTRQPSLCVGCACFVLDARHAKFWAKRYVENWLAYKRAQLGGQDDGYRAIRERALQAGKLLHKVGVNVAALDHQIEATLNSEGR